MVAEWIWWVFVFGVGACIGSFLNVVIYRLPKEKSLMYPPSACPSCNCPIKYYDNLPILSWLILKGKCRDCKTRISPRYFLIELFTGLMFLFLLFLFFYFPLRQGIPPFLQGGWLLYLITLLTVSGLIAASAIDIELWIIPISICWFVTAGGILASTFGPFLITSELIKDYNLLPNASLKTAALAAGAAIGLIVSLILLYTGVIKRSYDWDESDVPVEAEEDNINHRCEVLKEVIFLAPIFIVSLSFYFAVKNSEIVRNLWSSVIKYPPAAGFLGSLWGYFIGCLVVWVTRILGTLTFGKEAMGLGDVHLMGAAGAVIGPIPVAIAFFIAPFFGLGWAMFQLFFKKSHQIPYGPFLSMAIITVIILHDRIFSNMNIF